MRYDAYRKQTERAAAAIGGEVVSLAGGFYGVTFAADGCYVVVCIDLDDVTEQAPCWVTWREDERGEACCDASAEIVGTCRPAEFAELRERALRVLLGHKCYVWSAGVVTDGSAGQAVAGSAA